MAFLQFIFRDFWTFAGFLTLLYTTLYFVVNGAIRISYILKFKSNGNATDTTEFDKE